MSLGALALILVIVGLSAMSQLALKLSSAHEANAAVSATLLPSLLHQLMNPWTMAALIGYGVCFVLWLLALREAPLTLAYPFVMGLTVALVVLLGVLVLGETLRAAQLGGILLVCSGLVLLTRG